MFVVWDGMTHYWIVTNAGGCRIAEFDTEEEAYAYIAKKES